jgi:hypothetical protein
MNDTDANIEKSKARYATRARVGPLIDRIREIIRTNVHNVRVELPRFQIDYVEKNRDLRVQYLCNEIDEETFKTLVQRNDKKNRKNTEIAQVIQLSNTAITDIVYRLIHNLRTCEHGKHSAEALLAEIDAVISYCNEILKDIAFAYNCVQYGFSKYLNLDRVEKEKKPRKKKAEEDDDESIADDDSIIALKKAADALK